ncbi:20S-pre-rRNA D-site endonuclease nob1 [Oleoguttula sp. CCFEE 5521]
MADSKRVHALVVDSGPIIRNEPSSSSILAQAELLFTIPAVVSEIRDESTRTRFETLLKPFVTLRQPSPSSVKFVTDFARRTGDLDVLSKPDILIIALTYELECERNGGDWRLRRSPGQKELNGPSSRSTDAADQVATLESAALSTQSTIPQTGSTVAGQYTTHIQSEDATFATAPQADDGKAVPKQDSLPETDLRPAETHVAQKSRPSRPRRRRPGRSQDTLPAAQQAVDADPEWTTIPTRKPVRSRHSIAPKSIPAKPEGEEPVSTSLDLNDATKPAADRASSPSKQPSPALVDTEASVEAQGHTNDVATSNDDHSSPSPKVDSARESEPDEDESDSDPDSWITPDNLDSKQARDAGGAVQEDHTEQQMEVAVITTDFAMQNVILQMNLNLLSTSLQRVRYVRSTAMRCQACFLVSKQMDKQFCTRCGKPTLTRVSCSTTASGEFKIHLKKNFQYNSRGDRYSIPKPVHGSANGRIKGAGKGGWGNELILAEDQKEYERHSQVEKRAKERNLMDEDYLPSILTGDRSKAGGRLKVGAGRNVNAKKRS